MEIQSESDNRTSSVIEQPFWPITGYLISGRTKMAPIFDIRILGSDIQYRKYFLYYHATYDPISGPVRYPDQISNILSIQYLNSNIA